MNKVAIIILFILPFTTIDFVYGQQIIDTVIIIKYQHSLNEPNKKTKIYDTIVPNFSSDKNILIGTTVFTGSQNNYGSYVQGLELISLEGTECIENDFGIPTQANDKIISITRNDLIWSIDMQIVANCGNNFLGEIQIKNDSTLSLNYLPYGSNYLCQCCYGLKFYIKDFSEYKNLKYFMINNNRKTIKKFKKYR